MRNNWHALFGPIGIAQHRMALAIFIDNQNNGLIRAGLDFLMQGFGQNIGPAAVDHDNAFACDDETEVIVVAAVFIGRRGRGPDGAEHTGNKLDRGAVER